MGLTFLRQQLVRVHAKRDAMPGSVACPEHGRYVDVSVYAPIQGDGADLVHHNGNQHDGLVVSEPLSITPHLRLFSFSDQSF